jgi:hypothetical protein
MSTISRICLSLTLFLALAGTVYGVTSHEQGGTTLLLAASATFCFLGLVTRMQARRAAGAEAAEEAEMHVAPTIWPFGFAVAAVIIALGLIVSAWLLVLGGAVFVLSAAGWIRDVARSRAPAPHR